MTAPAPFRTAILFDDIDAAQAVALRDCLDPAWFEPELWPIASGTKTSRLGGLVRLVRQLRSRRPAVLYALPSPGTTWAVVLAVLSGIPVVTDTPMSGLARLARLLRGRYAAVGADAVVPAAVTSAPSSVDSLQHVLLEVLQMGSSWTTTPDRRLPMELMLGDEACAPAAEDRIEERGVSRPDRSVRFVARPSVTVFLPDREIANGTGVIICPGGGYAGVTIDKEGHDVARWLASRGIAGIVLKYRLPQAERSGAALPWPMQDLEQALALTRVRGPAWGIRSDRIGVMGFSAGGHMAAWASRSDTPPAFAILVYPVISMDQSLTHAGSRIALLGKSPSAAMVENYSFERRATAGICPTFLVHARDDTVAKPENSFVYLKALRTANAAVEALIYDHGGHGFGLGRHGGEEASWPDRCLEWIAGTTAAHPESLR